ncbi:MULTISPECIES: anthranilate synthase component I family protein [unclassified Bacillus (in: firmicutes)]|uniref:anthranilate synthase component I family protein n=1 Tax=unclassified Bacillus (in: firmicutes) TaxID=185979 RepID=UPI0008E9E7F3|nr:MULTISPECIES: anthranilate synthase component I family protein [unclassified Bacillus (in: firmicutes)]SFB22992.1 aminodeoxychorismate synthase, subunit I [Bacillus sp. UNCCL13]SFQ91138.1 aminodeoxychorismate synthase, subunit I [Bacillus sp. cl95]
MTKKNLYAKKIPYLISRFFPQYRKIAENHSYHVFFESGRGGRYSMAAFTPEVTAIGRDYELEIKSNGQSITFKGNPLHLLKEWMKDYKVEALPGFPDFQGGAIGFISYDYARYIEKLPDFSKDDLLIPDIYFMLHDEWFVFDHETNELWLMFLYDGNDSLIDDRVKEWERLWTDAEQASSVPLRNENMNDSLEVSLSEDEFMSAVEKIQHYISQGDVFQVNLSVRQTKDLAVDAIDVYEKLRILNPSPYMGYFHTPEFQLVSGSPELLIKKKGDVVSTRPIAGTRSRGRDEQEDLQLANELIENEKERAEHVMLVDLERNDLGRVCRYGTVEVDEFMVIEKYSHVMHIVSNVRGEIGPDKNNIDLIDAVFPGGTITGAPKIRTMEIIDELETVRRGPYTGSLGWIGYNDDVELNIIIRTMLVKDQKAHVQAGAGIVIDSHPKNEYKESLKKALALWKAKDLAEAGDSHDLND